jgi:2-C-methyl-D-erythritol 4-phosphate cytidylyltransferase/2-C-methyl-D-erythritol 2,4-cyclodiphosphate synthase
VGDPVPTDAIIVAAGSSARMGGPDKLLVEIGGRPLLAHTIDSFARSGSVDGIVVVAPGMRRDAVLPSLAEPGRVRFVDGGGRRQDSVRAGMAELDRSMPDPAGGRVVLVHDGARPCVSGALIDAVAAATVVHGAAIPVVPVAETVKRIEGEWVAGTVERTDLAMAQTPQGIRRGLLREALASDAATDGTWTDEAALLEACRIPVHALPGDPANLKVTVPADLARAAAHLGASLRQRRTGIGHDGHPFGPGSPLRLGGVTIDGAPRLHGHSDGDVALHAVADALLGAAALGDLGRLFPAGPATPAGVDSRELLASVVARLAGSGWRAVSVDLTVVAARPRLGTRLDDMARVIAGLLGLEAGAVSVKASTGNLEGPEGAGRSISALAIATIEARS